MECRLVRTFAGQGDGADQFAHGLRALHANAAGFVHAVGDREVKLFDPQGRLERRWKTTRPGYCIAIDTEGRVFVGQSGQIEVYDASGKLIETWEDAERLNLVTAIGFHNDQTFVADVTHRCIRRFNRQRKWLNDIGADNNTRGFVVPNGHLDFYVDDKGVVHAINPAKHRIERYTPEGRLLGRFGRFGPAVEDFPGCCNPTNLAMNADGNMAVTEKAGPRMKMYAPTGKLLLVAGAEHFDSNCKNMPIAMDGRGMIYVGDTVRLHVNVFQASPASDTGGQAP